MLHVSCVLAAHQYRLCIYLCVSRSRGFTSRGVVLVLGPGPSGGSSATREGKQTVSTQQPLSPVAEGPIANLNHFNQAGGACVFVFSVAGWYLLFSIMLQSVDFPICLPVGDLSTRFEGKSAREKRAAEVEV